jgi:adenosylcobinamide-phosphate synthase
MNFIAISTLALCVGYVADSIIGDPQGWWHIVRGYGALINALDKPLHKMKNKRLGGTLLVIAVLLTVCGLTSSALLFAWSVSPWLYFAVESILCWQCIAAKSLKVESKKVYISLAANDIDGARKWLSRIVGRDTEVLDESGITRAAVETVAENASDGVTAPLIFMALGGALSGCLYKTVNTMDSMIGYKNDRYIDFGHTAAKLDDFVNFIPSRLCALLMIIAARLCGHGAAFAFDAENACKIWKRDRLGHKSPNSAQTEAVMAGALNLRFAGDAQYFGKLVEKPYIGDDNRDIEPQDILRSHQILELTALLTFAVAIAIRGVMYAIL